MLCPWCHTPNRENAKFCKGCGQILAVETVAGGPAAPQPETQQAPIKEEAPGFIPEPPPPHPGLHPRDIPAPPPPESLHTAFAAESTTPGASAVSDTVQNDPNLIPTQILTPEQMEQQRQRRKWLEQHVREPQGQGANGTAGLMSQNRPFISFDVSDAPTILAPFPPTPAPAAQTSDIEPTIYAAPVPPTGGTEPTIYARPPAPALESATSPEGASEPTIYASIPQPPAGQQPDIADQPTMHIPLDAITPTSDEPPTLVATQEETPEQEVAEADQQTQQASEPAEETSDQAGEETVESEETQATPEQPQNAGEFPVLAIGATVGDRYEITQVVSEEDHEHVYEVADRKGYLHCWNCGSEENAEGDEFCNDCGAELLNAAYIMREYPASSSKPSDETVLQGTIVNTLIEQGHTYVIEQPPTLQSGSPNGVHLVASSLSDVGVTRQPGPNEDSTLQILLERVHESVSSPAGIFLVSDGMGGHANGQLASRMTAGIIADRIVHDLLIPPLEAEKAGEAPKTSDGERLKEILRDAIDDANSAICQINTRDKSDMGATLTGFMIVGERAYIFNVGDSRTYMLRDGKLYQLTNDHSLVGQLVAGGLISPEDVYTHPQRSQIYRSIGDKLNVQIDVTEQVIHPGDILLSCSDGLWEMVRDPQITDILNTAPDPQTACTQLIDAANNNGGEDNISAVVVFVR